MIAQMASAFAQAWASARAERFQRALKDPHTAQMTVLRECLQGYSKTQYGHRIGLTPDMTYERFAEIAPVVRYQDLQSECTAAEAGEPNQLWPGRPAFWENTSGSAGAKKPIPISARLRHAFAEAVFIQVHDLLRTGTWRPRSGRIAMAIAPPLPGRALAQDAAFLTGPIGTLARRFIIAPQGLAKATDPQDFRAELARAWQSAHDLELMTVWNPSYILAVMDTITNQSGTSPNWQEVWPNLQLISAWDGAMAAAPAARLRQAFPETVLQGKGLLCTEGPVTIPLVGYAAPVPFIDGAFIELMDSAGAIVPLWQAVDTKTYRLILTWPGGFCRYDLGDEVRVQGMALATPCLAFIGRADAVCDLVGEKLAEAIAASSLAQVLGTRFGFLVPRQPEDAPAHYCLVAEAASAADAIALDQKLQAGVHYARARALGQLGPIQPVAVDQLRLRYQNACLAAGQSMEAIKDRAVLFDVSRADAVLRALRQ
jgi:hypothetical protein